MTTVPLLLSFFALSIVSMDFALAIVLNIKKRLAWTKWLVVFAASLLGLSLLFVLDQYSSLFFAGTARFVLHLVWIVFFIADSSFLVTFICFFGNWLIARPMSFAEKFIAYTLGALFLASSTLSQISDATYLNKISYIIVAISIFYNVAVMMITNQRIANSRVRIVALSLSIVSFAMCPMMIAANIWESIRVISIPILGLAYFIVFLVFLFMAIDFSAKQQSDSSDKKENPLMLEDVARYGITARELEVIKLIRQGLTNKEIASYLSISVNTVNNHIANIFSKTDVRSRIDLLNLLQEASW